MSPQREASEQDHRNNKNQRIQKFMTNARISEQCSIY